MKLSYYSSNGHGTCSGVPTGYRVIEDERGLHRIPIYGKPKSINIQNVVSDKNYKVWNELVAKL